MDSWFTLPPLVQAITEQGLDVIGMVKETKQRYTVVSLKQLYQLAQPIQGKKGILRFIQCVMANGTPVKIVFVQNRNKRSEWLAILSTDQTLSEREIIQIYGMRWDIEVFFKTTKSLLKLQKEFQGRSYDGLISHTTIVFARYGTVGMGILLGALTCRFPLKSPITTNCMALPTCRRFLFFS